jgi:hypothetical protein
MVIQEFISFCKANPGEATMATAWTGGGWWIAAQAFLSKTGLKINAIPLQGSGAMGVAQTAGGHMDVCIVALGAAKSMIESGQLRLLAGLQGQGNLDHLACPGLLPPEQAGEGRGPLHGGRGGVRRPRRRGVPFHHEHPQLAFFPGEEAEDLLQTIQSHLRSSDPRNLYYFLNIDPHGNPVADMTADLLCQKQPSRVFP